MLRLLLVSTAVGALVLSAPAVGARKPPDAGRGRTTPTSTPTSSTVPISGPSATTLQSGSVTQEPDTGLSVTLNPSLGTSGWDLETSDARASLVNLGSSLACTVGGFDAPTHYARARRKLPETDDFAAQSSFVITAEIELPPDFYERNESYVRFITTDNYPGKMRSTGAIVGAASSDEWRVGFLMYNSDKLPRLQSDHEGHQTLTLWQGDRRLPVGLNRIEIRVIPSQTDTGSYTVALNGRMVGHQTGVQTVPSTLTASEMMVTRVGGCLDGAANQRSKSMTVRLHWLTFSAERPS